MPEQTLWAGSLPVAAAVASGNGSEDEAVSPRAKPSGKLWGERWDTFPGTRQWLCLTADRRIGDRKQACARSSIHVCHRSTLAACRAGRKRGGGGGGGSMLCGRGGACCAGAGTG
eukprot:365875-Chlamydomonas_euryale.AAC.1